MAKFKVAWTTILMSSAILASIQGASAVDSLFRSVDQYPMALLSGKTVLSSIANRPLKISYFEDDWKEVEIQPGSSFSFPQTGQPISVRFHDGAAVQTQNLALSTLYILFWNAQIGRWAIGSYNSVINSSIGLRSH